MKFKNKKTGIIYDNVEIAKLIGFEIIEDKKPLEEWTLKEVKEECESSNRGIGCDNCKFLNSSICGMLVYEWSINEQRKFTKEEISSAKAIVELYRDASEIYYGGGLYISVYTAGGSECMKIPHYKFPSIKEGETILIKNILEAENG